MYCQKIECRDFRNIAACSVGFDRGINVIYGDNAQGKTNLLEAVYMTALLHSFRPVKEAETVRFGCRYARLVNTFVEKGAELDGKKSVVTYAFGSEDGKKTERALSVNGARVSRLSEALGRFRVVLFCPEHLSLVQGSPERRREFLDVALSQLYPVYLRSLQKYRKILTERNKLLKLAEDDPGVFAGTGDIWSEQLAEQAAIIACHRHDYLLRIDAYMKECFEEMTGGYRTGQSEVPGAKYVHSFIKPRDYLPKDTDFSDTGAIKDAYFQLLTRNVQKEIAAGSTLYGPHRDDIELTVNQRSAKLFASQGQQRSLSLALKLAEGEACANLYDDSHDMPVFLFDDVLSELDAVRGEYLIRKISGKQVILTACDPSVVTRMSGNSGKLIRVSGGVYETD